MNTQQQLLLRRLAAGDLTSGQIAKRLGVSTGTVYLTAKKLGVTLQTNRRLSDGDIAHIATLNASGMTDPEIAAVLGVDVTLIKAHRRLRGIKANKRQKAVSDDELMAMADRGLPCSVIAERVGLSRELVTRRVNRLFRELGRKPGNFNKRKPFTRTTKKTRPYDARMVELLKAGKTQIQVEQELGVSRRTIRRRLVALFGSSDPSHFRS